MKRSIWAVFAGVLANFLIAVPIDILLHLCKIFPPMEVPMSDPQCVIAVSYRIVAAIVGGYLTAKLAPKKPMKHVMILGGVGVVLSSLGTYAGWDMGPHWYPILLIIISVPCSWLGGKIRLSHKK